MLFQPQKMMMPFGWFPLLLSISGHRINETQAISSRSLCKGCNLTKFRGFLEWDLQKTGRRRIFPRCFACNFRSKDAKHRTATFGSNKIYLNIARNLEARKTSTYFSTLQPSSTQSSTLKKASFRYRTVLKNCWEKAHTNQQQLLDTTSIAFSIHKTNFMHN